MPKRISKKEEEIFFYDPRDNGGIEIKSEGKIPLELMDFYKSLLPDTKNKRSKSPKSITEDFSKSKKSYKEGNLMKARSDLKKNGDKVSIETEMNIKKGLDSKVKKALKKSIIQEVETKIKGSGVRKIELDLSSEDEKPKKMKGKGIKNNNNLTMYIKVLNHLIEHIIDPDEKIDDKDIKQSIELIRKIKDIKEKKMTFDDSSSDSSSDDEIEGNGLFKKIKSVKKFMK